MIHEFVGLPGAGKSYMARQISKSKGVPAVAVSSTLERFARAALFALRHPFFSARLIVVFVKENHKNPKLLKHKLMTIVPDALAREQKARQGEMVESGCFQLLLSLYERPIAEKDIAPLFAWLKKRGYMVYIVEARRDVRERRIRERGRIPRGGVVTDPGKLAEWFALLEQNFETIKQGITKHFSYEIVQNN